MVQDDDTVKVETIVVGLEPGLAKVRDLVAMTATALGALVEIERNPAAMDWQIVHPDNYGFGLVKEVAQSVEPSLHDCVAEFGLVASSVSGERRGRMRLALDPPVSNLMRPGVARHSQCSSQGAQIRAEDMLLTCLDGPATPVAGAYRS